MTSKTIIALTQFETKELIYINPSTILRMQRYKDQHYTRVLIGNGPEQNVLETPQEIMEMVNTDAANTIVINGKIDALDAAVKAAQKTADDALTKANEKGADTKGATLNG